MKTQWGAEYQKIYYDVIKKRLPAPFVAMYEKNNWLHDWYLKNYYIANTGSFIQAYSTAGSSTVQIELCNAGPNKNILLIYKNVLEIKVEFKQSTFKSSTKPTGFGQIITNIFEIDDASNISHDFIFDEGDRIFIKCKSIGYRRVVEDYWR